MSESAEELTHPRPPSGVIEVGRVDARRPWVENRPTRRFWPLFEPRDLWAYRDVGIILAQRDLKVRYKQTFFGVTWAFIQPLIAMVVFTLILGEAVGLPSDGVPYAAFVMAGLAVWFPFYTAVSQAAESLARSPGLVTKVYFPRPLAPLAAVLAPTVDLLIAMTIAVGVALVAGVSIGPQIVLVPLCCVGAVVVALSFGIWLSALNVLYRDVRYALGFVMQLLFFSTPVVYALPDDQWEAVFAINPLVGLLGLVRWSLLGADAPSALVLLISLVSATALLVTGLAFFRHTERQFADRI
jgi:lipopolysaccharide transport system permease protein